jgi:transcriptional regulator NrdR family protein
MSIAPQDASDKPKGIECPRCGCRHFDVDKTRPAVLAVRRKRSCRNCGKVVWTKETIWMVPEEKGG